MDTSGSSSTYTTLNVDNLLSDITPAGSDPGVIFSSNGRAIVNIDLGPWRIVTTSNGVGAVVAGNFTSDDVDVTVQGVIQTNGSFAPGIDVFTPAGIATIRSYATITTEREGSHGIFGATDTGDIDILSTGDIAVHGEAAHGIYAATQDGSIGIGSLGSITTERDDSAGISAETDTGDTIIALAGNISTRGDDSAGIFAEAGGATIIYNDGNIKTTGGGSAGIFVDSFGGAVVISTGDISTSGEDAPGIAANSAMGDVGVMASGKITTTGGDSDGISAESSSGMAVVLSSANISATGTGSAGIYAYGNTGAVVMNTGSVVGGPCCAGVMMDSANFNQLLNGGTITAGLADYAVDMLAPSNTVDNFGTITGDVRMFDGFGPEGSFINHQGALLNSGGQIFASYVLNDGTIAPGGRGTVASTFVAGQFVQGRTGTLAIDVDGATSTADQLIVSDTADLAGKVAVHLTSVPLTAAQSFLILTGMSGTTNNGLELIANPALHATLTYPNPNDVVLGYVIDFSLSGLNPNQRAIARNFNDILAAGAGGVAPVLLGLLNTDDVDAYKAALNQLLPEIYSDAEIAALYSGLAFSNSLLSCKVNGTDTASIIREGQCLWAGASARFLDTGTTFDQIGFNETAGLFTAGAQVALDDVWRLGVAAGYQSSTLETATGASSSGSIGQAGIALKYNPGSLLLAGALSGGGAHYDTRRIMSFGGFSGIAEGDQELGIFSGTLRAAYVLGSPALYFKPSLDASLTRLELSGFTEEGGGGAALSADGQGQTVFSLMPLLETGTEWWLSNGTLIRPLIRAGAVWYDNADFALTASFADAPAGVAPFTIHTNLDEVMGVVGAGIDVISGADAVLRFSYDGQFGETTNIHAVGIKGSAHF